MSDRRALARQTLECQRSDASIGGRFNQEQESQGGPIMRANWLATAGATPALMLGPVLALAGDDLRDDTVSSCTGINCSSVRLPGSVSASGVHTNPWTINALARTGECVRFDLISPPSPSPDMEIIVVAPNGTVFRNDDRSRTDRRPLVKIGPAPTPGWYRVVVTQFE